MAPYIGTPDTQSNGDGKDKMLQIECSGTPYEVHNILFLLAHPILA